ncbi:MAG: hypothetical protein ACM3ZQ_09015 [Bacillota bacterium]
MERQQWQTPRGRPSSLTGWRVLELAVSIPSAVMIVGAIASGWGDGGRLVSEYAIQFVIVWLGLIHLLLTVMPDG